MAIAIYGGSFNPVHFGHFEIVRQVNLQFTVSKIIVVPVYKNPLKENLPSIPETVRLKMLAETFSEFKKVEISSYELNKRKTSYTYNTLEHFRELYPQHQFYLILGEDAFASFHLWANADKILKLCTLLLFKRQGMTSPIPEQLKKQLDHIQWVDAEIPMVSATEIRSNSLKTLRQKSWLHPKAFSTWEAFYRTTI